MANMVVTDFVPQGEYCLSMRILLRISDCYGRRI